MTTPATMEVLKARPPSDPSSATYPRWVMLEKDLKIKTDVSSCSTSGDPSKTSVAARTSTGLPIQISLRIAEPPAVSCICVQIPSRIFQTDSKVLAAHDDSVLIMVTQDHGHATDHFVYNAGDAAADPPRPPSLSLLPPFHCLSYHDTGLMRRGKDELVVAGLEMVSSARSEPAATPELPWVADLSLFRAGEWSLRPLEMRVRDGSEFLELRSSGNTVVPVGDRLLCWVDLSTLGVVLCDVFEETPKLQYIPLPRENIYGEPSNWNVCATAAGDGLKFVNVFPRCCCGAAGASDCKRSSHAYTIQTWTMMISNDDDMEWVKDGMVEGTDLWPLDSYKGLRRFPLDHPIVSMDDPNLICFRLHEPAADCGCWDDNDDWLEDLLMVNMTRKTIHSVSRCKDEFLLMHDDHMIPSIISYFFNSYPTSSSSSSSDGVLIGPCKEKGIERPRLTIIDDDEQLKRSKRQRASITTNLAFQPASMDEPSVQPSEIFEAFQEIPSYGLDHDVIIKAYSFLSCDNGRQFRSFIRLPKNMRKDWLMMEVKAKEERSFQHFFS